MKNFPYTIESDLEVDGINMKGKTLWHSPSMAVATFVFHRSRGEVYVLANKRGEGCPDFVGYWSCPCGYVDFGEDILDAAKREVYEESGLTVFPNLWSIHKDFSGNENVTFRFYAKPAYDFILDGDDLPLLTDSFSEPDEIATQAWINLKSIGSYAWAFNHDNLILDAYVEFCNMKGLNGIFR